MTHDKEKLSKQDNKQLGRKAIRLLQLNLRFCLLLTLFIITSLLVAQLYIALHRQPKHLTLHQYVRNFFNDPYRQPLRQQPQMNSSDEEDEGFSSDELELGWSDETVELFQDQLGIIIEDDGDKSKSLTCRVGEEFIVSALPGANDEYLNDIVWQYVSLMALETQTIQTNNDNKKLSLKAFVTEQMRVQLNELFEDLPLRMLSNLPSTCFDLKYAQIIGNKSPIKLKEIAPTNSMLLLDPKAKRVTEIVQLFGSKMRPFWRFNRALMAEVQQEFLVTKTLQEIEATREMYINFVGLYITSDDKLLNEYYQSAMAFHRKNERTIFIVICDAESLMFCHDSFEGKDAVGDARILRKSQDAYDFALLASCNSTIVSNDFGVLHALLNGGDATVHRPEPTGEPEYYIPFIISEQMANWYAID